MKRIEHQTALILARSLDVWMSHAEIAEHLGYDERTIRNWYHEGRIPLIRMGGHPRGRLGMMRLDLLAWMKGEGQEGVPDGQCDP